MYQGWPQTRDPLVSPSPVFYLLSCLAESYTQSLSSSVQLAHSQAPPKSLLLWMLFAPSLTSILVLSSLA